MKKTYTSTFKPQVVFELLNGTKTVSQCSSEFGVHVTVLRDWKQALSSARTLIWNTDQGSHFTSPQMIQLLLEAGIQISMDGKGRATNTILLSASDARSPCSSYAVFRSVKQSLERWLQVSNMASSSRVCGRLG